MPGWAMRADATSVVSVQRTCRFFPGRLTAFADTEFSQWQHDTLCDLISQLTTFGHDPDPWSDGTIASVREAHWSSLVHDCQTGVTMPIVTTGQSGSRRMIASIRARMEWRPRMRWYNGLAVTSRNIGLSSHRSADPASRPLGVRSSPDREACPSSRLECSRQPAPDHDQHGYPQFLSLIS